MTLMTVRAAATQLGVGYSTLKQWIHQGRVRTTQTPGGHHRISEAELERLASRHTSATRRAQQQVANVVEGLSARNQLAGFVEEVRIDGLLGQVLLRIGHLTLTAVITADAIRALKLRRGDDALAIIKSTDVMIAKRPSLAPREARRVKASGAPGLQARRRT
jgi:molybdopterin-binding protein